MYYLRKPYKTLGIKPTYIKNLVPFNELPSFHYIVLFDFYNNLFYNNEPVQLES